MRRAIQDAIEEVIGAVEHLRDPAVLDFVATLATHLVDLFSQGGKVLVAGNGGSLCDAVHFAEELTGFFRSKRVALPAIALADPGHLSCVANDIGYEHVFSRSVEALGREGDLFIALTTSGNSENLIRATCVARERGLYTVAFLGKGGGALAGQAQLEWIVEGCSTSDRVQELHMAVMHIVIEAVEQGMGLGCMSDEVGVYAS